MDEDKFSETVSDQTIGSVEAASDDGRHNTKAGLSSRGTGQIDNLGDSAFIAGRRRLGEICSVLGLSPNYFSTHARRAGMEPPMDGSAGGAAESSDLHLQEQRLLAKFSMITDPQTRQRIVDVVEAMVAIDQTTG